MDVVRPLDLTLVFAYRLTIIVLIADVSIELILSGETRTHARVLQEKHVWHGQLAQALSLVARTFQISFRTTTTTRFTSFFVNRIPFND